VEKGNGILWGNEGSCRVYLSMGVLGKGLYGTINISNLKKRIEMAKKNLSGSFENEEVTIIGNTPTRTKPKMQDLDKKPEVIGKPKKNVKVFAIGFCLFCVGTAITLWLLSQLPAINIPL